MKHIPMKKALFLLCFILIGLNTISAQGNCQDTLYVNLTEPVGIDTVTVDIEVANFNQITSMQWTVDFDPSYLQFIEPENFGLGSLNASNFNITGPGELRFAWFSLTGLGVDLQDGSTIYSLKFASLQTGDTDICFTNDPLVIEISQVVDGNVFEMCMSEDCSSIPLNGALHQGNITAITQGSCANPITTANAQDWIVHIFNDDNEYMVSPNTQGFYSKLVVPGTYTTTVIPPNYLWSVCDNNVSGSSSEDGDIALVDFQAVPFQLCPELHVDVSTPFLRRCFDNFYSVDYCNQGSEIAEDAYIEIELDPAFTVSNVYHPNFDITGNILTLNVGDVAPLECGKIQFDLLLDCDTELGTTKCVEAHIFPDTICAIDPAWSGASIEVYGECESDSVRFFIENVGDMDMLMPVDFIVTEDDVMFEEGQIDLATSELTSVAYEANGSTYRINVNQVNLHPGLSSPTTAIEACGTNSNGTFSLGYVNMFPNDDQDNFVAIDCQQVIGSYDPNDKRGYPLGYRDEHYIKANTDIKYHIRFQNIGTDTAFRVVIVDTLSEHLDVSTIRPGASSHSYEFELRDREVRFIFDQINLVDSTTNEPGSHGFVKFSISQVPNNPDGTLILNAADIYFDFNDPVRTNTTDHLIGSDFIESVISGIKNLLQDEQILVRPHPVVDFSEIEILDTDLNNLEFTLMSITGQRIFEAPMNDNRLSIQKGDLKAGVYLYQVSHKGKQISVGKLIVQ